MKALPGIVLDYCALGKAKEGSTEVHAHRGIPAFSVILEGAQEEEDWGWKEEKAGGKGALGLRTWYGGGETATLTPCLTLTFSNISMVGKVFKEQTKPSGFRKPATTCGTPGRND